MTNKTIKIAYEITSAESAAQADAEERGFDNRAVPSFESAQDAAAWLLDEGAIEASCSEFHPGVWFVSEGRRDIHDGRETRYSFHLDGFTEEEERVVFNAIEQSYRPMSKP